LVSSANWIVVSDSPSVIDDEMCRTPSTPETPSSMVLVTLRLQLGRRRAELRYRDRDHRDVGAWAAASNREPW